MDQTDKAEGQFKGWGRRYYYVISIHCVKCNTDVQMASKSIISVSPLQKIWGSSTWRHHNAF